MFEETTPTHHLLIMAYGGPGSMDDVRPYLLDVRSHRPTSEEIFREVEDRYEQIGGRSPILELTRAQGEGIERALNEQAPDGERWKVWAGMRHWYPYIAETVGEMKAAGVERAVTMVMAPHFSKMSIGLYNRAVAQNADGMETASVDSWSVEPAYLDALEDRITAALDAFPEDVRGSVPIIYTAHSLPERIRANGDPYEQELASTFEAMKTRFPTHRGEWAFQSAAMTKDPWLGPDASDVIAGLHGEGIEHVLICPVGFVCEHVEILYDIDVEMQQQAKELGMQLERIEMLNDHPELMAGLARLVRERATDAGWM
ncbi:MAG TPA: ferrochelatase [Thermomicrobiales bacterium]|nr:ferrochelatase [Thermomicrobiales bacterium]